jgi:hypothetical protein
VEFYSAFSEIGASIANEIFITQVSYACQFFPEQTIEFFAPPPDPSVKRKTSKKGQETAARQILRPGWESSFKKPLQNQDE